MEYWNFFASSKVFSTLLILPIQLEYWNLEGAITLKVKGFNSTDTIGVLKLKFTAIHCPRDNNSTDTIGVLKQSKNWNTSNTSSYSTDTIGVLKPLKDVVTRAILKFYRYNWSIETYKIEKFVNPIFKFYRYNWSIETGVRGKIVVKFIAILPIQLEYWNPAAGELLYFANTNSTDTIGVLKPFCK